MTHLSLTAQAVSNLVEVSEDQPVTTSLIIAQTLGREHDSVILLVRKHEDALGEFGNVIYDRFEIGRVGAIKPLAVAILNEQQATLLISFMSNTPKVVDFKIRLVKAFYEMRMKLEQERKALALPVFKSTEDIAEFISDNCPEIKAEIRREMALRRNKDFKDFEHVAHSMYALREAADRIEEMYKQMNEVKKCMRLAEDAMIKMNSIKGSIFDMVDIARQELGQVADAHPEIDELVREKMMP
jgi:phage regulator Rha-like protein